MQGPDACAVDTMTSLRSGLVVGTKDFWSRFSVKLLRLMSAGEPNPVMASLLFFVLFFAFIVCLRSVDREGVQR